MAVFAYKGVDSKSGKTVKGVRDADSQKALRAALRKEGVVLTAADEQKKTSTTKKSGGLLEFLQRPSVSDVAIMTRQLATLVRAGIPLVESLSALTEQIEKESFVKILTEVGEDLKEGSSFAKTLAKHPKTFNTLYISMIAAGEESGSLEAVLDRLADFMDKQSALKGKVTSALAYPMLMGGVTALLVGLMMVTIVPKVTSIYDNLGQELPWYTALLIFVSDFLAGYWWLLISGFGGGIYYLRRWRKTEKGRYTFDKFWLNVPKFGRLSLLVSVARFSRTLSTLLSSGVPLLKAMGIVKNVIENAYLEEIIVSAIEAIREGDSISAPLKRSKAFPSMMTHMIAVGERSGQLEQMLEQVCIAYESDVDAEVGVLTGLLAPAVIVVMGGIVAFIAFAILAPMLQMNEMVG